MANATVIWWEKTRVASGKVQLPNLYCGDNVGTNARKKGGFPNIRSSHNCMQEEKLVAQGHCTAHRTRKARADLVAQL